MTSKEIEDGADTILIAELDDAAEARIIDVLAKIFVTNKYPGLRAAIINGIERHQRHREAEEKQRQQAMFEAQRYGMQSGLQNALRNSGTAGQEIEYIKQEMEKQKAAAAQVAPAITPNPFNKMFGKTIF